MIAVSCQILHDGSSADILPHYAGLSKTFKKDCDQANSLLQQQLISFMWPKRKGDQHSIEQTFREPANSSSDGARQTIDSEGVPARDVTIIESGPLGGSDYRATIDAVARPTAQADDNVEVMRFPGKPPIARLIALDEGSLEEGEVWRIRAPRHVIGRVDGHTKMEHDDDISGQHAEIRRIEVDGEFIWKLIDLESTNGTFVRKKKTILKDHAEFIVGCQRLSVESGSLVADSVSLRIPVATIETQVLQLGRDEANCAVAFPDDVCMNTVHAKIGRDSRGRLIVSDNNSKNGLWIRISSVELKHGFQFLLGGQRFQFEIPTDTSSSSRS